MEDQFNTNSKPVADEELIKLLRQQNQELVEIRKLLQGTIETEDSDVNVRAEVTDVNMSIGSMISLIFKWIIATIPVGIVIGIIYLIIFSLSGGF